MDPINERIDRKIAENAEYYDPSLPDSAYANLPRIVKMIYNPETDETEAIFVFADGTKIYGSESTAIQVTPDGQESVVAYKSQAKGPYGMAMNRFEDMGYEQEGVALVPMTDADFEEWAVRFTG